MSGAYLHGSAAAGQLRPHSDLDLLVVVDRALRHREKRALTEGLMAVSQYPARVRRSAEVTVVAHHEVRPWRYPPRMEFQSCSPTTPCWARLPVEHRVVLKRARRAYLAPADQDVEAGEGARRRPGHVPNIR